MRTEYGELTVGDAHIHFLSHSFFQKLGREAGLLDGSGQVDFGRMAEKLGWELPGPDDAALARRWVEHLASVGVDFAVLFGSLPGEEEAVAAASAASGGRLASFSMINPLACDPGPTAQRLADAGLSGILLFPAMHGFRASDERLYPLYEVANRYRMCVFVHCGVLKVPFRARLGLLQPFSGQLASPLELQRPAALFPEVAFIVPHLGSGMLRELLMLADQCANVYTDTSGTAGWARHQPGLTPAQALSRAVEVMGPHRLLFGSDSSFFPRGWRRDVFELQMAHFREAGLSESTVAAIMGENLQGLLERTLSPAGARPASAAGGA
jgi:predicted TIM-barrel fold metal-dependent hydrolase